MRCPSLLLLLLLGLLVHVAADVTIRSPDNMVAVDFVGSSGQIKLYPNFDTNKFIKIKWTKLEEVTAAGGKVQSADGFASKIFEWVGPESVTVQGKAATKVTLRSVLSIKDGKSIATPRFNVSAYLFGEEVALADGSSTVTVPANNLKFSFGVDGWPFESTSNFLLFGAEVDTPKADSGSKDARGSDGSKTKIAFGEGNIVLQNSAIVDGVQVSISNTVSDKYIDWKFPAFQHRLDYDPTMGYAGSGAAAIAPTVALIALLAAAVLMQ